MVNVMWCFEGGCWSEVAHCKCTLVVQTSYISCMSVILQIIERLPNVCI